jgi:hypothetical protein
LSSFYTANQLEASTSYIERTARKLYPILNVLKKKMIPEKKRLQTESTSHPMGSNKRNESSGQKKNNKILTLNEDDDDSDSDKELLIDLTSAAEDHKARNTVTDMKNILGYLN